MAKKPEKANKSMPKVEIEDDDYEVEEPVADAALMAMMPMSFGKQEKQRDLSASFAKTKRVPLPLGMVSNEQQETTTAKQVPAKPIAKPVTEDEEDESSDDMIGPMPAADDSEDEDPEDDEDEFPISHEVVLKDHQKVLSYDSQTFIDDRLSPH